MWKCTLNLKKFRENNLVIITLISPIFAIKLWEQCVHNKMENVLLTILRQFDKSSLWFWTILCQFDDSLCNLSSFSYCFLGFLQYSPVCTDENCRNSLSHFFRKNFVKAMIWRIFIQSEREFLSHIFDKTFVKAITK